MSKAIKAIGALLLWLSMVGIWTMYAHMIGAPQWVASFGASLIGAALTFHFLATLEP